MSARSFFTISLVAAGVLAPAAIADAAKTSAYPTISKIEPMRVSIGETMTITGKSFLKGKGKNTVVFRRSGKRSIFVKADGLSTKRLALKVPAKLQSSLGKKSGTVVATRFQIRVLAKRFGKKYTTLSKSPTIVPASETAVTPLTKGGAAPVGSVAQAPTPVAPAAPTPAPAPAPDCDGDGVADAIDTDDDNDLLIDTTEAAIGTNRCLSDTDGDGMTDGWEYQSAIDQNQLACPKAPATVDPTWDYPRPCAAVRPYPSKRPYTNPLNPDPNTDYDGDGMLAWTEHAAWEYRGARDASYKALTGSKGMWYSAGERASIDTASDDPDDNDCVGEALPNNGMPFGAEFNTHPEFAVGTTFPTLASAGTVLPAFELYLLNRWEGDACLEDDERDEDGDFLQNWEEFAGPMSQPSWWASVYDELEYQQVYYGTNFLDWDSVGNSDRPDGLRDTDGDDFLNIEELYRGPRSATDQGGPTGVLTGLWVNPFNPCLPNPEAQRCQKHPGFEDDYPPFSPNPQSTKKTRWPLYAHPLYGAGTVFPETYEVVDGPDPDSEPDLVTPPTEVWTPDPARMPVGFDTTAEPPLHPLPRPLP